jgi:hypothetical protein
MVPTVVAITEPVPPLVFKQQAPIAQRQLVRSGLVMRTDPIPQRSMTGR